VSKLEVGTGIKALIYFMIWATMTGSAFWAGMNFEQEKQVESNVEVLSIDSEVALEIAVETKKQRDKVNEQIKKSRSLSDGDYVTSDGLQLLQSTLSAQERRVDQSIITKAFTNH